MAEAAQPYVGGTENAPGFSALLVQSAVAKNTWRLVPILALAYLFNYLDRTSVGFAALQMNQAIGLSASQFCWGAGMMFFSYCLLEVPSNLALDRYGASAPGPTVLEKLGYTVDNVVARATAVLERAKQHV